MPADTFVLQGYLRGVVGRVNRRTWKSIETFPEQGKTKTTAAADNNYLLR